MLEQWRSLSYADLACEVLSLYIDDIAPADLKAICRKTYTEAVFGTPQIVPLRQLEPGLYLQELSNGPTLAFKDMAMQLLGNLFEYELARRGEELNILGATSGDTGSAAEYAMRGKKGVRVFMTSPNGRMSPFQQAQMFSLQDKNIHNIAIDGVFDDCQDIVKAVSSDLEFKRQYKIGTVNSINWARLMAQVVYYFAGYFQATNAPTLVASRTALPPEGAGLAWGGPALAADTPTLVASRTALPPEGAGLAWGGPALAADTPTLVASRTALPPEGAGLAWGGPALAADASTLVALRTALPPEGAAAPADWQRQVRGSTLEESDPLPKVSFTVPSGNFGNVCAGHVARMMGLPIDKLVVATNENDVLDEFFRTGVYRVRVSADTHETSSPSMDISKASNFERFVFDLLEQNGQQTKELFLHQLGSQGSFDLSASLAFHAVPQNFGFVSGKSTHADRLATIKNVYERFDTMVDTHTADGIKVARENVQPGVPMVVMETALPIKFAATIVEALGKSPDRPSKFEGIEALPKRVKLLAPDAAVIKAYIAENVL
jgi:threonine synthase